MVLKQRAYDNIGGSKVDINGCCSGAERGRYPYRKRSVIESLLTSFLELPPLMLCRQDQDI